MGLSPRTLRPANNFTPRSITGLALWLDASDASTLFQNSDGTVPATATSDPVGYWGDKSGNARHAVQSSTSIRPAISATAQGGKRALAFLTSTTTVVSPVTVAQYVADATTSPKMFFAWVARPEGGATSIVFGSPTHPNSASRVFYASDFGAYGSHIVDFGSVSTARLTGVVGDEASVVGHVYSAYRDGAVMSIRRDGVEIIRKTNATGVFSDTTGTLAINTTGGGSATSSWMEFMAVAGVPSASNITRIERYLASKWGIQLLNAPQVSNADAQDWINRVYAWNGTVSSSTAEAVNQFCNSIDSAGIRDRFYRLNLFCGGTSGSSAGLAACLVPLYRSTAYGGTLLGGNIDTNTGPFVVGDYAETGASGGLVGNGTSKFLKTGLTTSALPQIATGHLSVYASTLPTAGIYGLITSWGSGFADPIYAIEANRNGAGQLVTSWGNNFPAVNIASGVGTGLLMTSRTAGTSLKAYRNGSQIGTTSTTNITPAANTGGGFGVFANVPQDGAGANWFPGRLAGYSIGAGMSDAQAAAFSAAMTTFQTALGRNV